MIFQELSELIRKGEDSEQQFKLNMTNAEAVAAEMVAFSNTLGGKLIIGVTDTGEIQGLSQEEVARLNLLISNAASQKVIPAINPLSQSVMTPNGIVLVLTIFNGNNKPYQDNNGTFWVKCGADKRKATSREEIQRLFQSSHILHADEIPVPGFSPLDLDFEYFRRFFEREYGEVLDSHGEDMSVLLENMNLCSKGALNLSGALLFAQSPQRRLPMFMIKGVCFPGQVVEVEDYIDSRDFCGKLEDVFRNCLNFVLSNLTHIQNGQSVNSIGIPEIPRIALEEIIANALIHRDYFISAPTRVLVFQDRVELISPGHLPNNLSVNNIKAGNSNIRNPILASFASKLIPYRGLGFGIRRALKAYPHMEFEDDRRGNLFKVTIYRGR